MAGQITPSRGLGDFEGFSWPELDNLGNMVLPTTVHTWQCNTCGQAVGQHISRTSRHQSVVELLTQCIEALSQHRRLHTHPVELEQYQPLAAD